MAAWSAGALTLDLVTANPFSRALVALAALNVLLALRRDDARLRPLLVAVGVAMLLSTLVSGALGHTGDHVLFRLPPTLPLVGGAITLEALVYGLDAGLGIATAVLAVAPLVVIVDAHDLVDALPGPLRRTGAALGAALLLLPGLLRTAAAVREAQISRGLISSHRWWRLRDIAIPVVLSSVEESVQLAEAMEARGHGGRRRTAYAQGERSRRHLAVLIASLTSLAVTIAAGIAGLLPDWYPFPSSQLPDISVPAVLAVVLLLTPLICRGSNSAA